MFEVDNEDEAVRRVFKYLYEGEVPVPLDYGVWLMDESRLERGLENRLIWCVLVDYRHVVGLSLHATICYVDSETGMIWLLGQPSPFPPRLKRRQASRQIP